MAINQVISSIKVDSAADDNKVPVYDASTDTFVMETTSGGSVTSTNGVTTHDDSTTGTQNIAHGFGSTPTVVRIYASVQDASSVNSSSRGTYNGTTTATIFNWQASSSAVTGGRSGTDTTNIIKLESSNSTDIAYASVTVDATNIVLTWSKTGSPVGTANIMWEVL